MPVQKIPLTAKLDSAYGLVQFWQFSKFFPSNYFQIGHHVVLLPIQIARKSRHLLFRTLVCYQVVQNKARLREINYCGRYRDINKRKTLVGTAKR